MKINLKTRKITWLKLITFLLLTSQPSYAQKLSLGFGAYSVSAKVNNEKTSVSNLGAYKIQYHSKILEQFELLLGYNIIIQDIVTGDKSFGPTLGISFYPLGSKTVTQTALDNFSFTNIKKLNPYIYAGFSQRQYQSVRSSYSGFAFGGGSEMGLSKEFSIFGDFQYSILDDPNAGEATEILLTVGIMYNY